MKDRSLPLGIDIGSTRIRVAHAIAAPGGPQLRAVVVREVPTGAARSDAACDIHYTGALIEDAVLELGTRERRCVSSIGEPDALLRSVHFPKMTCSERERSARFEAQRYVDFPIEEATVRIHPFSPEQNIWTLGIARSKAVNTRLAVLRAARLRVVSIDHEAFALQRALPHYDAIVDVGCGRTCLHVMTSEAPLTFQSFSGGADITRAIERELCVDEQTAERRKRILGTAGAGERARAALTSEIASLIEKARQKHPIGRVAVVGNTSRLPGITAELEDATGALFELPVSDALGGNQYPEDVVRSGAPDWTMAAALSRWGLT